MREKIFFQSNSFKLEGVLYSPQVGESLSAAIVLHPHPQFGGSMDNNVVDAICDKLAEFIVVMKFNCRGVGRSEGVSTGGQEEGRDVLAAISYLKSNAGVHIDPERIIFIGYSWGTYAGFPVVYLNPEIKMLVGIACPIGLWSYNYLEACKKPKLLITGSFDQFSPREKMQQLYDRLPEPKNLIVLETDHFYWGQERALANHVAEFIRQL